MDGALPCSKFSVRHLVGSRPTLHSLFACLRSVGSAGGAEGGVKGTRWGDIICMFSFFVPTWQVCVFSLVSHIA